MTRKHKRLASLCCLVLLSCYHIAICVQNVALTEAPVLSKSRRLRSGVGLEERVVPTSEGLTNSFGTLSQGLTHFFRTLTPRMKDYVASWKWIIKYFPHLHVRFAKDKVAAAARVFPDDLANSMTKNLFEVNAFIEWDKLIRRSIKRTTEEVDAIITAALVAKFGNARAIQLFTEATFEAGSVNAKWLPLLHNHYVQAKADLYELFKDILKIKNLNGVDQKSVEFFIKVGSVKQNNEDDAFEVMNRVLIENEEVLVDMHKLGGDVAAYRDKWHLLKFAYYTIVFDSIPNADAIPIKRLKNLADKRKYGSNTAASWIADSYAQSAEGFNVLRIAKQTLQKEDGLNSIFDKAFAKKILKQIGLKWDRNNYDIGNVLKHFVAEKGIADNFLQSPEGLAVLHAVTASMEVKAKGTEEVVLVFRKAFGDDLVAKMIRNADQKDLNLVKFKSVFEKMVVVA
ncbi:hypothetical protein CCR75_002494 [Bremia lactucae]|uniref:Secreted RxLR effector n=1 Tax=Bremia lactucae TaxID=4779 RepID=A0A976IGU9_BRELC|nr:hypothetical protein CCR75_002494 [Bremia lactucae]